MGNALKKDQIDSRTGLSDREKKAVRESWHVFCDDNTDYGVLLFTGMFLRHPEYLDLFVHFKGKTLIMLQDDPKFRAHASAVGHQFSALVDTLDDPDILVELIRKNAANHLTRKGVQPKHFESLCQVTLEIMAHKVPSKMSKVAIGGWDKLVEVMILVSKNVYEDAHDAAAKFYTSTSASEHSSFGSAESEGKYSLLGGTTKAAEEILASHGMTEDKLHPTGSVSPRKATTPDVAKKVAPRSMTKKDKETESVPKKH